MQELISISEASGIISDHIPFLGSDKVGLDDAYGRILAESIDADQPIPPYDRVMMDGIAIKYESYADGQRDFQIAGTQSAGMPALQLNDPTQCIEVMTGAVLPEGADSVIKIEELRIDNGSAHLSASSRVNQGQHIHPLGSDQDEGACLIEAGSILSAPELAIAASVGQTKLRVGKLPNILLITTGDEVIPADESPLPHQIRRSHAPAVCASIESKHLGKVTSQHVPDNPEDLTSTLKQALEDYDLILLTGGISMGKFDYVAPVMKSLVGDPLFHGVAQRPGKPFAFWSTPAESTDNTEGGEECKRAIRADDGAAEGGEECKRAIRADDGAAEGGEECKRAIFALPGNPVSVMACLARYIIPALRQMRSESWKPSQLSLAHDTIWNAPFPGLLACQIANNQIHPNPPRNSGDYTALAGSQGICEIDGTSRSGTPLHFYPW